MYDHRREGNQNLCKNICRHYIIAFIAHLILDFLFYNDITDYQFKVILRYTVGFLVFPDCLYGTGV